MAAEDINGAGGIGGKPLELVIANDEYKPDIGANAYKKLALSDKVVAVIGTASSGVSLAIVDQMARYKVPMLDRRRLLEVIGQSGRELRPLQVLVSSHAHHRQHCPFGGDFVVNYLFKVRNLDRAAILSENAVWTNGVLPTIKEVMTGGGVQVVSEERFDLDTKDFKPLLAKVRNSGAHFIVDFSSHVTARCQAVGRVRVCR